MGSPKWFLLWNLSSIVIVVVSQIGCGEAISHFPFTANRNNRTHSYDILERNTNKKHTENGYLLHHINAARQLTSSQEDASSSLVNIALSNAALPSTDDNVGVYPTALDITHTALRDLLLPRRDDTGNNGQEPTVCDDGTERPDVAVLFHVTWCPQCRYLVNLWEMISAGYRAARPLSEPTIRVLDSTGASHQPSSLSSRRSSPPSPSSSSPSFIHNSVTSLPNTDVVFARFDCGLNKRNGEVCTALKEYITEYPTIMMFGEGVGNTNNQKIELGETTKCKDERCTHIDSSRCVRYYGDPLLPEQIVDWIRTVNYISTAQKYSMFFRRLGKVLCEVSSTLWKCVSGQ